MSTIYDVTTWSGAGTTAIDDIGAVINSIIADVKVQQPDQDSKPGAVIYIPPGDYSLKTRVTIDVSYLQIKGSGHGFTSSSIRYNTADTSSWAELNPGGSRVRVENADGHSEAFLISRSGSPRLSGIEFVNFCIDGVHFTPDENSYRNGKIGIHATSDTDSLRIIGMGMVYLERGLVINGPDALSVQDNFIAECGSCVELTGASQASLVNDNLIGAGPHGESILAEGAFGLIVSGNNIFPRGSSSVHLRNSNNCTITGNRLHSFYAGMVHLEAHCASNLVAANHFLRQVESFPPFQGIDNGLDDHFGLVQLNGSNNTVVGNHFSHEVPAESMRPAGATATIVLVKSGDGNYVATNHTVATTAVMTVVLDGSTANTKILDSGAASQLQALPGATYGFRPTP